MLAVGVKKSAPKKSKKTEFYYKKSQSTDFSEKKINQNVHRVLLLGSDAFVSLLVRW
jgi:hypothetical protein